VPRDHEWVEFSAWLLGELEFGTFWRSVPARMESNEAPTDFDEPRMAQYLRKHILDCKAGVVGVRVWLRPNGVHNICAQLH